MKKYLLSIFVLVVLIGLTGCDFLSTLFTNKNPDVNVQAEPSEREVKVLYFKITKSESDDKISAECRLQMKGSDGSLTKYTWLAPAQGQNPGQVIEQNDIYKVMLQNEVFDLALYDREDQNYPYGNYQLKIEGFYGQIVGWEVGGHPQWGQGLVNFEVVASTDVYSTSYSTGTL